MAARKKYPPVLTMEEGIERLIQAAVDQGFGRRITDPDALRDIRILMLADDNKPGRKS